VIVLYIAAVLIVVGVALFVTAPLFEAGASQRARSGAGDLARLEHERELALQGLRELEFDHQMHKLAEEDWSALRQALEERALRAMARIEELSGAPATAAAPRVVAIRSSQWNFCPECGQATERSVRFCPHCGRPLPIKEAGASG
jgi:NADH pyrophosphatase NudC (nudix superfamily)